jgi:hypothetical protein
MDPITLIMGAIAAGTAAGLTGASKDAINDAYSGLKTLLLRRIPNDRQTSSALDTAAHDPDTQAHLVERLQISDAVNDPAILRAAATVLALADPEGAQSGKYRVTVTNSQGIVIGDHAQVTQHFNRD